jgi:hypothetical protein
MYPVITQAIAADRAKEIQAYAAAEGRACQLRRSRRAGRTRLLVSVAGFGRGQASQPAARPLRDPRAAEAHRPEEESQPSVRRAA